MKRLMNCSLFATTAFAVALSLSAHATLLEFDLNANFGDTDAGGDVQIQITEAATSGDVHVTVVNNTLGFVDNLYLNYSPVADIANAVIYNFDDGSGTVAQPAKACRSTCQPRVRCL